MFSINPAYQCMFQKGLFVKLAERVCLTVQTNDCRAKIQYFESRKYVSFN